MEISFDKPENLDGGILIQELENAGVKIPIENNEPKWPRVDGNGRLWLDIDPDKEELAKSVVAAHNGTV